MTASLAENHRFHHDTRPPEEFRRQQYRRLRQAEDFHRYFGIVGLRLVDKRGGQNWPAKKTRQTLHLKTKEVMMSRDPYRGTLQHVRKKHWSWWNQDNEGVEHVCICECAGAKCV